MAHGAPKRNVAEYSLYPPPRRDPEHPGGRPMCAVPICQFVADHEVLYRLAGEEGKRSTYRCEPHLAEWLRDRLVTISGQLVLARRLGRDDLHHPSVRD